MKGVRVVVIGAAGQLGSAICRAFAAAGAEVQGLTRRELDLADPGQTAAVAFRCPDVIINCASYNDVDGAADDAASALRINHAAVDQLARAADACGATLVHYSTDFVFDGEQEQPYSECDRPNPLGAYGRSKLAGEAAAASAGRHYVLRLSSVFGGTMGQGAGGRSTIDRIINATLAGDEVTAFSDRTVTPSYTHDVSAATRHVVMAGAPHGVYHATSSGWTYWSDLAREVADMLERPARIRAIPMSAVPMRAARPLRCALSSAKLAAAGMKMPDWRDAVGRHLAARHVSAPQVAR